MNEQPHLHTHVTPSGEADEQERARMMGPGLQWGLITYLYHVNETARFHCIAPVSLLICCAAVSMKRNNIVVASFVRIRARLDSHISETVERLRLEVLLYLGITSLYRH
jgi:hypothetical protein